ncbi:MAG: type II secretion system protein [Campylobacteraceae bacterium]|nr:type II secretion system protein [Campylobacteraceae bacterium]
MKKAFTLIELLFVIVVAGIIAVMALPRMDNDNIYEAANQIISHIRYTQHLAMQDNKYDPNDPQWYMERWQLAFHKKTAGSDRKWSYSIFSDASHDGNPNRSEMAVNPSEPSKFLTGGYSAGTVAYGDAENTKELNIGHKFDIENVVFSGGCATSDSRNYRISFDNLGRPMYDKLKDYTSLYQENDKNKLVLERCDITICTKEVCPSKDDGKKRVTIAIEPESGYAHILKY